MAVILFEASLSVEQSWSADPGSFNEVIEMAPPPVGQIIVPPGESGFHPLPHPGEPAAAPARSAAALRVVQLPADALRAGRPGGSHHDGDAAAGLTPPAPRLFFVAALLATAMSVVRDLE